MNSIIQLKKSNCKNCYKCIRNCPVKSIRFSASQAHIVEEDCILCGQCFVSCPQNAKQIRNDLEKAKYLLSQEAPVIASVAPSFVTAFPGINFSSIRSVLRLIGFTDAFETAVGATPVKEEYRRILQQKQPDFLISSCCFSVNLLIRKYFPDLIPYLAPVITPMHAHSIQIKEQFPNAKTIFIGPCISKKKEADTIGDIVDCVLTFEELSLWIKENHLTFSSTDEAPLPKSKTRLFPIEGGIIDSMVPMAEDYDYFSVSGPTDCIQTLKNLQKEKVKHCFIEMSICKGSCIGGPISNRSQIDIISDAQSIRRYAGKQDYISVMPHDHTLHLAHQAIHRTITAPTEQEIKEVLKQMGKTKPEDELNCGSCGYNTCREKATAIFQGKADLSMCLPFLKEKAETFSDHIFRNSPNALLVLNDALEVQQINQAACKLMHMKNASDILGEPVIRILDPKDFLDIQESGKNIHAKIKYLADYDRYVEQSILYDKQYHLFICIMRDITEEEKEKEKKITMRKNTIAITDKVVEKQMRAVQEIASLLGETTAETKVALTKLKESMDHE